MHRYCLVKWLESGPCLQQSPTRFQLTESALFEAFFLWVWNLPATLQPQCLSLSICKKRPALVLQPPQPLSSETACSGRKTQDQKELLIFAVDFQKIATKKTCIQLARNHSYRLVLTWDFILDRICLGSWFPSLVAFVSSQPHCFRFVSVDVDSHFLVDTNVMSTASPRRRL